MNPHKFVGVAQAVAALSKDPSTKVGAVVLSDDGTILSVGFNGFPRGVDDNYQRYIDRPTKLSFIAHAESNAIAQAARNGVRLMGSTIVLTALYPCSTCAKQIIQAGIKKVISPRPASGSKWIEEWEITDILFREAGIEVEVYV